MRVVSNHRITKYVYTITLYTYTSPVANISNYAEINFNFKLIENDILSFKIQKILQFRLDSRYIKHMYQEYPNYFFFTIWWNHINLQ